MEQTVSHTLEHKAALKMELKHQCDIGAMKSLESEETLTNGVNNLNGNNPAALALNSSKVVRVLSIPI
jgi:hypothetical protein